MPIKNISATGTTGGYGSSRGTVWIQPKGCGTPLQMLGCIDFDDLEVNEGDVTSILCFDPNNRERWQTVGHTRTMPDDTEFEVTAYVGAQATWLEWLANYNVCPLPIYVFFKCVVNGHGAPTGWERGVSIADARATARTYSNLAKRNEDTAMELKVKFKASAPQISDLFKPKVTMHQVAYTAGLWDIAFAGDTNCGGNCGDPVRDCETGFVIGNTDTTNGAVISKMMTDCVGWEIVNDDNADPSFPFADDEDAVSLLASLKTGYPRLITVRGTTDALAGAEIAYSDTSGQNWVLVGVGGLLGQYAVGNNALTQTPNGNIWLALTGGYIHVSEDNGVRWLERESGTLTAGDDLYAIHFQDDVYGLAGGENGKLLVTQDGGEEWFLLTNTADDLGRYSPLSTGETVTTISSTGRNWYIGGSNGELWRTIDFKNWSMIAFSGQLSGSIADIEFNECAAVLLFNEGGGRGRVLYAADAFNFEPIETPPNNGLRSVKMLSSTEFFIAGAAYNSHGLVLKGTAYPFA